MVIYLLINLFIISYSTVHYCFIGYNVFHQRITQYPDTGSLHTTVKVNYHCILLPMHLCKTRPRILLWLLYSLNSPYHITLGRCHGPSHLDLHLIVKYILGHTYTFWYLPILSYYKYHRIHSVLLYTYIPNVPLSLRVGDKQPSVEAICRPKGGALGVPGSRCRAFNPIVIHIQMSINGYVSIMDLFTPNGVHVCTIVLLIPCVCFIQMFAWIMSWWSDPHVVATKSIDQFPMHCILNFWVCKSYIAP